ncbi:SdrD B-like domain-containing protein [Arthrobacter alpinus]|uniref:SdrD B-like domain-containing protein n=1 Tax=Arthrobacter alpinus TaxID=656366 RepID=UPI0013649460|nr:SdrD B-like domain-containing protein [Arthrobacter alpinus]
MTFASLIGVGTGEAAAATPGITTTVTVGGVTYNGTPVVSEGQVVTMNMQYSQDVVPGSTVTISLGANVTLGDVPAGNEQIESITKDPSDSNKVLVKFKDPLPDTVQGLLSFNFSMNQVNGSSKEKIVWTVDGEEKSLDVIIKNNGDDFANVNDYQSKSVSNNGNLGRFVSYNAASGKVTLATGVIGAPITYTLNVDTKAAKAGYIIADALPAGMTYKSGSFTGTQTTWDTNGLNKAVGDVAFAPTIANNTFSGQLDLPASSMTTINYSAHVADEAARVALEAQLQAAADKVTGPAGGNYNVNLKNTVTFGNSGTKEATVSIGGKVTGVEGPGVGAAFTKDANWLNKDVEPQTDGSLVPPADVTYTLNTNLTQWDGSNVLKTLTSNVVISDKLPAQASWNTADAAFLTSNGIDLEKIDPVAAAVFAGDEYVGKYFVDGQSLFINVGKDNALISAVAVKAHINSVTGLNKEGTAVPGETKQKLTNRGEWSYSNGLGKQQTGFNREAFLFSYTESADGFNAPDYFKKETVNKDVVAKPGESIKVDYKFTVGAGKGIDLTKSSIVDYVDTNIYDISDLDAVKAAIAAKYAGSRVMGGELFDVTLNGDGNLAIALNDAGIAKVTEWGIDKAFELTLTLVSKPIAGKQTLRIKNKATLFGEGNKALFWSEVRMEATTYGDEAEIRKTVRDTLNTEWTQNLRAEVDAQGNLISDQFVYNVALVPHGKYTGVPIFDVVDVLPEGLEFVGFVTDDHVDDRANPTRGVQDLVGNVQARFEDPTGAAPSGKVVLFQKEGTNLDASKGDPAANILVRIKAFSIDEAIINSIGSTKATITPSNGYPLSIAKVNAEDPEAVISDTAAHFQILDAELKVVVDNVFVEDGALRVTDDEGKTKNVKVATPGTYTVKEIKAPAGYKLSTQTIQVVVGNDGSSDAVAFPNEPVDASYAVGDFVWVDANKNGLQDDAEVLEGVTVTLLDGAGKTVATTETDAAGRYMFDELPAGEYQIKFELTTAQSAIYDFTTSNAQANAKDADDSDANPATGLTVKFALDDTNVALTKDYRFDFAATEGIDPTWDAGVIVKPSVSIGDFVWVDSNRDGLQSEDEPGIKDVVLAITGPDGKAVTDVFGKAVVSVKTDDKGAYTFVNLPVLKAGESYTVTIDQDASKVALAPYVPTLAGAGDDRKVDSSTWTATSTALTMDGDRDQSLDFGFVLPKVSVGDFVWVDSNRDGLQSVGEPGIKGVVLAITGPDGKAVTDVFGKAVVSVKSDDTGAYTFVDLPVLKAGESYTVTIDQDASKVALAPYVPTLAGAGDDRKVDSSTWTATSTALTMDGDRDQSLDFGFVLPKVSVGDYVWVDSNRDGLQSVGEPGIKDVVLAITGPNGKAVTDVFGKAVVSVKTDDTGAYTFVDLPVLKAGESYTVSIDKDGSKEALAPYIPTIETEGNREGDSSTWTATSTGLTMDGDRDQSLDLGFVLPKVSVGDYVWVDSNRDGLQSVGEPGIKDVVLAITGPNGKAVTDVFGKAVVSVKTDDTGAYTFVDLPVLKAGESYTVSIDKDGSKEALAPYIPTIETEGNREGDSGLPRLCLTPDL